MSIPVSLDKLRVEAARFGATPFLLTVSADGRPHSVSVSVAWEGDALVATAGRRSAANAAARPLVSLLWPPIEAGGYSLIVDGDGAVSGSGDQARISVHPTRGVLHRPAASPTASAGGCSADCVPLMDSPRSG
jgi:hypothetical protein